MKDHKAWCSCERCEEARRIARGLKPKRRVPRMVMAQWQEKRAKEEEEMLMMGKILIECPKCKHQTYVKIEPEMKCPCCMYEWR